MTPNLTPDQCHVRVGGHEWDRSDDTDEAPSSYCVACGMQGRDYIALRTLRLQLATDRKRLETEKWHEGRPDGSGWYIVTVEANDDSPGRRFTWPAYFWSLVPDRSQSHWGDLPKDWVVIAWRDLPPALAAGEETTA